MPTLKKNWKKVTLPKSGAECQIGITFGDKLAIQEATLAGFKLTLDENGKAQTTNEFDGSVLQKKTRILLENGLKAWDFTDENGKPLPVNWENIALIESADADFLVKEISKILEGITEDDKKK